MSVAAAIFEPRLASRRRRGRIVATVCGLMCASTGLVLAILVVSVLLEGASWLSWNFFTKFTSIEPTSSGIKAAIFGTIWLVALTALISVPVGVGSAVYLEEYARPSKLKSFIQLNIANLAGVPSIVYGLLGLAAFVRALTLGRSIIAGALTMSLLVLPVIIIASREALIAVPQSLRLAAYALGATKWTAIRAHVLPAAIPGIMTGMILALSRAIGEAAPLIIVGAALSVRFVPTSMKDDYTVLPIQIYNWCDQPHVEFHQLAAAGIIVLLCILIPMNGLAIGLRAWHQRRRPA